MTGSPGIGDLLPPWNMSLGMNLRSTKLLFLTPVRFTAVVFIPLLVSAQDGARVQMTATSSAKTSEVIPLMVAAQDKTLLITTHDLRCNMQYFDALLALNRRVIALGPVEQVLTPEVLTRTYGVQVVLADGTSVALT